MLVCGKIEWNQHKRESWFERLTRVYPERLSAVDEVTILLQFNSFEKGEQNIVRSLVDVEIANKVGI